MKKSINKYFILMLSSGLILGACKKDEVKLLSNLGKAPVLTASANTLVLVQANQTNDAVTFSWSKQFLGVNTANVVYTLQMIKDGSSWSNPGVEVSNGELITRKFTVGQFNKELLRFIDPPGAKVDILVRVKSEIPNSDVLTYSAPIKITVTTYGDIVIYGFPAALNIAGNYQGWDPASAPQIVNAKNGGYGGYEGYINFTNASPEFKIVKGDNWGAGDYSDGGGGALSATGGPNLMLPNGTGVYRLRVSADRTLWAYDKINSWAVTGNATAMGWPAGPAGTPGQDHDMVFDPASGSWSVTLNLTAGELKFRANDAWVISFGDGSGSNSPANFEPDYDKDNIKVTVAGNYTIRLDIGIGGNYKYSLKKN